MREGREQQPLSPLERLIRDHGERLLLEGSHFSGEMSEWRQQRERIGELLQEGTVLDIGCANGLLMACLAEWSGKKLDAYGVDADPDMIARARLLFPERASHFVTNGEFEKATDFPDTFDNVYWNVWDNFELSSEEGGAYLDRLDRLVATGEHPGRLILGSYHLDRAVNLARIEELKQMGWRVVRVLDMHEGRPEMVLEVIRETHG